MPLVLLDCGAKHTNVHLNFRNFGSQWREHFSGDPADKSTRVRGVGKENVRRTSAEALIVIPLSTLGESCGRSPVGVSAAFTGGLGKPRGSAE